LVGQLELELFGLKISLLCAMVFPNFLKEHCVDPGVDVMITIFHDFCQFPAKIWRFLKNQRYDQIFAQFSFVLSQKRHFCRENIFKIITSVPGLLF
jgi:hypothetical protein